MPRVGLTPERLVVGAASVADELGFDRLTLAAVAKRFGVTVPSLYKHVNGLDALKHDIAVLAVRELTAAMSRAAVGRAGGDALHAIANATREYAKAHPGRYAASARGPAPGDAELIAANEGALTVYLSTLAAYGIGGEAPRFGEMLDGTAPIDERSVNDAIDAVRSLRAAIHGFVTLEATGGFGLRRSLDESYARLIDSLDAAFRAWPQRGDETLRR